MKVILGVELGNEYLKIAVASDKGAQSKIIDCLFEPIASRSDEEISSAIINSLKKKRYKSQSISVSLSRNFVTMRNLHLPSTDQEEIEKMIGIHVTRIVPHKSNEVVSSYCLSGIDEMGYGRVLVAIVHNENISRQLRILDRAGFLVDGITLSSHCVWEKVKTEFCSSIPTNAVCGIFDVDADFTDFILFDKDNLLFTRTIAVKGAEANTELGLRKLLGEARQLMVIFGNEEVNSKPEKIFLSGAIKKEMVPAIEDDLETPVQYVSPLSCVEGKKDEGEDVARKLSFIGVANVAVSADSEKKLSFVLPEMKIRKMLRDRIREISVLGSLVIYSLCVICFIFLGRIYNQQSYMDDLIEQSSGIESDIGDLVGYRDKVNFVKEHLEKRRIPMLVIHPLQKLMKENMSVTFIRLNAENKVTVRGRVFHLSDVFNLISELEKIKYFVDVQTRYTRKQKFKGDEMTEFEVSFMFDKSGVRKSDGIVEETVDEEKGKR